MLIFPLSRKHFDMPHDKPIKQLKLQFKIISGNKKQPFLQKKKKKPKGATPNIKYNITAKNV